MSAIDVEIVHGDGVLFRFEVVHTCSNQINVYCYQNQLSIKGYGEMVMWPAEIHLEKYDWGTL